MATKKQHDVVARIRTLETMKQRQNGLSFKDCTELHELQLLAKENNWIYW
jgi:hypothetical protein